MLYLIRDNGRGTLAWTNSKPRGLLWVPFALLGRRFSSVIVRQVNRRICAVRGHDDALFHLIEDGVIATSDDVPHCVDCCTLLAGCTCGLTATA